MPLEITFLIDETLSVLVKSLERMMMHLSAVLYVHQLNLYTQKRPWPFLYPPTYIKTCKEDKTYDYAEYIGYTRQSVHVPPPLCIIM